MTEQLKQSLSAVIDGEADAFELRRVLDELDRDADLRATWSRYHLIGSVIRGERTARTGAVARALERRVPIAIRAGSSAANAADAFAPAGVSTGLASGSWRTFATRRAAIGFSAV
ncbi:MAG: sigma-E factor negative regulatory protein, partial [Gammaproteobacteria bacterium]